MSRITKILLATILVLLTTSSFSQETMNLSLERLNQNLLKARESIEETKDKIRTVRDAKFLPELYFALAEFYIQEAKYLYFIKVTENKGTPIEELNFSEEKRLKILAIKAYNHIIEKFPNLPDRDKALFLKAHEMRGMGELKEMIQVLGQLIREYPNSSFWAESQIIISDYFLDQKKEIDTSLEILKKILDRPVTHLTPVAYYKLGWIQINKDKFYDALLSFENAIFFGNQVNLSNLPEAYRKSDIRREALLAMVWPYSEVSQKKLSSKGRRHKVIDYFYKLSPDPVSYRKVLFKLGGRFVVKQKFITSTKIYFELLRNTTNLKKRIEITEKLYVSMRNTQKEWPVNGLIDELNKTLVEVRSSSHLQKAIIKKSIHDSEIFMRDIATRQHKRAKKNQTSEDWDRTIEEYRKYLWAFPRNKYTKKIQLNLAESYFNFKKYLNAAKEYERLARSSRGKIQKNYLDLSIQSYISSIRNESNLSPLEVKEARNGLRSVGRYFIKKYSKEEAVPSILFNIAQTYYDERDFSNSLYYFKKYIKKYPTSKNIDIAVHLILDSFNQVEDFKGLMREGRWILSQKRLKNSNLKSQVRQIVQQADLERVLGQSQDSSSYMQNLLNLAGKYKGSKLGAQALYQAFDRMRSKRSPKAYKFGEELVLKHGNSEYAQTVTNDMVQMALVSADFRRAANYLELFYEKYQSAKGAREYLQNAASIRESMGDFNMAAKNYRILGDLHSVARMHYFAQDWLNLKVTAQKANGIYSSYWEGLAKYRLHGLGEARELLIKTSQTATKNNEEGEVAAHALYLLSMDDFEHYQKIKLTPGNEVQAVNDKSMQLKKIEQNLIKLIESGSGRWAIAGLHELGKSYQEFAKFINEAPVPRGLSSVERKQFSSELKSQSQAYIDNSRNFFKQCFDVASKNKIFTSFAKSCRKNGKGLVDEAAEIQIIARAKNKSPKGSKVLRKKLIDSPRDINLLQKLAGLHVRAKDFSLAELILHRALEIQKNSALIMSQIGSVQLYKNDLDSARGWFEKALTADKNDPLASLGIAGLYKKYGYKTSHPLSKKQKENIKMVDSTFLHPIMKNFL